VAEEVDAESGSQSRADETAHKAGERPHRFSAARRQTIRGAYIVKKPMAAKTRPSYPMQQRQAHGFKDE
jgi:hypothetical protein